MDEENDEAPPPPEAMAASFEDDVDKPELIDEYNGAPDRDEELPRWETEGDEAPPLPEMIAAAFEKRRDEEEKREECDDDDAPCPPELMAASYEAMDSVDREVKMNTPDLMEHDRRIALVHYEAEANFSIVQEIGYLDERNTCELPATVNNAQVLPVSSLLSEQYRNINVENGLSSVPPTTQGGYNASLAASSQGQLEIPIGTNQDLVSRPRLYVDPNNQSLPLLEATLVEDKPDEPVYDAFPLSDTQHDVVPGWLQKNHMAVILGLVLVAIAAIVTVILIFAGGPAEPSIPPIMISTNSTAMPVNEVNTVSEII
jgi:hypothetical protein